MAIQTPGCCDTEWQLLYKILQSLPDIGGGGNVQSGQEPIANGAESVSVTFLTAYDVAPDVVVTISRPSGENLITVNVDSDSVTTTGFSASLGAATGSGNYVLNWMANTL